MLRSTPTCRVTVWLVSQVLSTHTLLHPSEDEPPVCSTLPIRHSSRACWAPEEAARLTVMHKNDNSMQLVVTTYELGAQKSRDRMDILGKVPWQVCVSPPLQCDASSMGSQVSHGAFSSL